MWLQLKTLLLVSVYTLHTSADQTCHLSDEPSCSIDPTVCASPPTLSHSRVIRSTKLKNCCRNFGCGRTTMINHQYHSSRCARFARSVNPQNYHQDSVSSKFARTELPQDQSGFHRDESQQDSIGVKDAPVIQPISTPHDDSTTGAQQEDKTGSNKKESGAISPAKAKYYQQYRKSKPSHYSIYQHQRSSRVFHQSPQRHSQTQPRPLTKLQSTLEKQHGFLSADPSLKNHSPLTTEEKCPYSSNVPEEEDQEVVVEDALNVGFSPTSMMSEDQLVKELQSSSRTGEPVEEHEDLSVVADKFSSPPPRSQTLPTLHSRLPASTQQKHHAVQRPVME